MANKIRAFTASFKRNIPGMLSAIAGGTVGAILFGTEQWVVLLWAAIGWVLYKWVDVKRSRRKAVREAREYLARRRLDPDWVEPKRWEPPEGYPRTRSGLDRGGARPRGPDARPH